MEKYVIPRGEALEVYEANGAFDRCVDELKAEGLEVITAKQLAEARMLGGANHTVSRKWTWLAENFNYLRNGDILVASRAFNPLLQYPAFARLATECHRQSPFREFCLTDEVVGYLLEGAKHKGKVLLLKRKDVQKEVREGISTDDFGKMELTAFLFGDKAEDYGRFLKENGIKNVSLYVVGEAHAQKQGKAFSRALWADNLNYLAALFGDGYGDGSCGTGRAFGVRAPQGASEQPEAASQGVRSGVSLGTKQGGVTEGAARAVSSGGQALEASVLEAVRQGIGFRYDGLLYVPVNPDVMPE